MTRSGDGGGDTGFLARWSRRKQQARGAGDEVDAARDQPGAATDEHPGAAKDGVAEDGVDEATLSDEELLARYELPDPETLTASDDVAAFMRSGVPARLRNMALRRLWRLDPVLANLDGLNDYDEDYTDAAMLAGVVKTAYQVGKGGAAHLQEAAEKLAKAGESAEARQVSGTAAEDEPEAMPSATGAPPGDATDEPVAQERGAQEHSPAPAPAAEARRDSAPEPEAPRRRRMVFSTPGGGESQQASRRRDE